jgi:chromosome partitioning protein
MGTVITVMNMKGGVGKTTVTMHFAGMAARSIKAAGKGLRVLVIDYDAQFNLSQAFLSAKRYFELEKQRKTTLAILVDDDTQLNPYELQVPGNHKPPPVTDLVTQVYTGSQFRGSLDIIPSTLDLMYLALGKADAQTKPMEERFQKFIEECKGAYDLIFIDCHPAGSLLTKTSLRNSDHVLIPVMPQRYAVRGIGLMMNFIGAKNAGSKGPTAHILFNGTSRTSISQEESDIRADPKYSPCCLINTLRRFKAFSEPEEGKGFVWVSGKPYSTEALRNLRQVWMEFEKRIGG